MHRNDAEKNVCLACQRKKKIANGNQIFTVWVRVRQPRLGIIYRLHVNQLEETTNHTTMKPSANALLLLLIAASASSSSSSSLAAADSSPAGVTCTDSSSLQLNECLTAGNAICSSSEGWAFGIDPADQRIKLWKGDQVRNICGWLFDTMQSTRGARCGEAGHAQFK